jgi:hypothetical protein
MMNPAKKRALIFASIFIVVGLLGLAIFINQITKKTPSKPGEVPVGGLPGQFPEAGPAGPSTSTASTTTGGLPLGPGGSAGGTGGGISTENGTAPGTTNRVNKITAVYQGTTAGQTLNPSGGVQYYDKDSSKFYTVGSDGQTKALSDKEFYKVSNVTWAPSKDKAVIYYPDGSKIIYDFQANKQVTLPNHWDQLEFSTAGDALSFISYGAAPEDTWLGVVNSDGSGARAIEKLGENSRKALVSWSPNNQSIGMFIDSKDATRSEVYLIGKNGENFRSFVVDGRGFQPVWSPSGQELLYSVYNQENNMNPTLWITQAIGDTIGDNMRPLAINTFADKCTYVSETEIICGVPTYLAPGSGMATDLAFDSTDNIVLINTLTGSQINLLANSEYNVANPIYSSNDHALYFFNDIDGSYHELLIPQR